jgi:hypothetical protein
LNKAGKKGTDISELNRTRRTKPSPGAEWLEMGDQRMEPSAAAEMYQILALKFK